MIFINKSNDIIRIVKYLTAKYSIFRVQAS